MTRENDIPYRTPHGSGERLADCDEREWLAWERPGGVLEIRDPILGENYRIGDGTTIADPAIEAFIKINWEHNALGLSTRQLTNTEDFETKAGASRWSRKAHAMSAGMLTYLHGGTPLEVLRMVVHDEAHRKGSHLTDDLLEGRGKEDAHDGILYSYFQRNGFARALEAAGIIDETETFVAYGNFTLADICDHGSELVKPSFVNQPGSTGSMETERLQYLAQEGVIWIEEPDLVREAVAHAVRAQHIELGDHMVFDDAEAARLFNTIQTRCSTEHWNDPVNDIIDQLIMTLDRRLLSANTRRSVLTDDEQRFFPGDVLYVSEEDWRARQLDAVDKDAFSSAIHKIAIKLAGFSRDVHAHYGSYVNTYDGPQTPKWLQIQNSFGTSHAHSVQGTHAGGGYTLDIEMMPGKARSIDPWVVAATGAWHRLSQLMPETAEYRRMQSRWLATGPYDALIDYDAPDLGLTQAEKRAIPPVLLDINAKWERVLSRPPMPDDLLQQRVWEAGKKTRVRARGGVILDGLVAMDGLPA